MSSSYLWTLIPFLIFLAIIVRFELRHRRREAQLAIETDRYMRPVARTTGRMFEKQYGRPSTDMEKTFPEIKNAK